MRNPTPTRRATLIMLITIAVVAAIVYTASAIAIGRPTVIRDAFAYNAAAQRLLNTGVYEYNPDLTAPVETATGPSAFAMPGYTVFLAAVYLPLTHTGDIATNTLAAQIPIIVIQLLLAVGAAVLISFAGLQLGGRRLGWTAGAMAVAYVPFGMNATVSLTETLALLLMSALMVCVIELFRRPEAGQSSHETAWMVAYGVLGGLSILVRPSIALWLLLPLAARLVMRRSDGKRALQMAGVGALCMAIVLAPWVVRNAIAFHEFIPLTATASTQLLDSVGGATFTPTEEALMAEAEAAGEDPLNAVALQRLSTKWTISPWGFISWKANTLWQGVSNITSLPIDILADVQASGPPQAGSYADAGAFLPVKSDVFYSQAFVAMKWYHMAILLLAFVGVALGWRRRVIWVLATVPAYYAAVHTVILFMVRYFYPAMPALILLAAFGAVGGVKLAARQSTEHVDAWPS